MEEGFNHPIASTSNLKYQPLQPYFPSSYSSLPYTTDMRGVESFCCSEPNCLEPQQEGGAGGGAGEEEECQDCLLPNQPGGSLSWDQELANSSLIDCQGCILDGGSGVIRWEGGGEDCFMNECCEDDCFGTNSTTVAGGESDCQECWEALPDNNMAGGRGNRETTTSSFNETSSISSSLTSVTGVETPQDLLGPEGEKGVEIDVGEMLKGLDEQALQNILDCCCCGVDGEQLQLFDPTITSLYPNLNLTATSNYLPRSATFPPHLPSLTPLSSKTFACKWSGCNFSFGDKEGLVYHVNQDHLHLDFQPTLTDSGDGDNQCLWDDCSGIGMGIISAASSLTTPTSILPPPPPLPNATNVNLLQHLLQVHLEGLQPNSPLHPLLLLPITSTITSLPTPYHHQHILPPPPHPHSLPQPHPHPHPHTHNRTKPHKHVHPYGVRPIKSSQQSSTNNSLPLLNVTGGTTHACQWKDCELNFSTTGELMSHLSRDHIGSGKSEYECCWKGCCTGSESRSEIGGGGKVFAQRQKIMRHLQTHTGDRPFVCEICKKSFSEATTLTQHTRTHTSERPFACTFEGCGKTFSLASALTIHTRTHTGSKPFHCSFEGCNSQFSESSNLNKHFKTHSGLKEFKCDWNGCQKVFARSDQLNRHRKIHEKELGSEEEEGSSSRRDSLESCGSTTE